jgi:tetratricopeptide (TPR) repeat protein
MYTLIPQFLVILSILTIIIIVLRRLPEVTIVEEEPNGLESQIGADKVSRGLLRKLIEWVKKLAGIVVYYAKAAKEHSVKVNYLERFSKALHLDTVKMRVRPRSVNKPAVAPDEKEAIESIDRTEQRLIEKIQKNPADRAAYEELGKLYLEQKNYQDAEEVYEYLTRNYETEDGYFSRLGTVYFNLKKYENAIAAYNRAIELRSDMPNRYINLSLCYEAIEDYAQAAEAARKAVKLDQENITYLALLADLLLRSGQKSDAIETLERLLELDPVNESARQRLMELKF